MGTPGSFPLLLKRVGDVTLSRLPPNLFPPASLSGLTSHDISFLLQCLVAQLPVPMVSS